MSDISHHASNACIYTTYAAFLILGLAVAWKFRNSKEFLASLKSQAAVPLAFNFLASGMGCGILLTYPQIGIVAGVQGVFVYALSSALPIMLFAFIGPLVRRRCPDGFVLTEWVFERFGYIPGAYLGLCTILTMFLYMVSELTCIETVVNTMTGLNGLPAMIVECVVTTVYTTFGGFHTSFFTDNIQGVMMTFLLIIVSIAMGSQIHIDTSLIRESGLLNASKVGWQLVYILPVAIASNDCFLSGFWLRTFASRNDKELFIACGIATALIFVYLVLIGFTGIVSVWSRVYVAADDPTGENSEVAFFLILEQLPAWVSGLVLVFVVALSTAVLDSLQSAMVSSVSNDIFRNRLPTIYVRVLVFIVMVPAVVVALKSPNVLEIYLISDLISAAVMPSILLGLWNRMYFLNGFDVLVSGFGGVLTVFFYGLVYYDGDVQSAGGILLLKDGIYTGDWSGFGAFVAAPVGAILWLIASVVVLRMPYSYVRTGRLALFDKPVKVAGERELDEVGAELVGGRSEYEIDDGASESVRLSDTLKTAK
ncbi:uncharacterized protein V1518DRAFT_433745 [Limtongia smithiae]|uniref:uncharacterized protein n=1 Tax=Limtongia smithiae TaxID=1125753 RepID=UPI0034CDE63C